MAGAGCLYPARHTGEVCDLGQLCQRRRGYRQIPGLVAVVATACALCERKNAHQVVAAYRIVVCDECWDLAAEGWPTSAEPVLFRALAKQGLLIADRNEANRLPRDYAPPADYAL